MNKTATLLGIITGIIVLALYVVQLDSRYAKADDLYATNLRLDLKILEDEYVSIRDRVWALERQYPTLPPVIQKEVDLLKERMKQIDDDKRRYRIQGFLVPTYAVKNFC